MIELSGKLDGVGLSAIVRFLAGLKKTGCLRLSEHDWHGEIGFQDGEITHATLGTHTGLSALDALIEALPSAQFEFDTQARAAGERSLHLNQDMLLTHIDELGQRVSQGLRRLPSAASVPRVPADDANAGDEPLPLDRATLQTLIAVDGRRSVREIVALRGTFDVLWQLARLAEMGLVRFEGAPLVSRAASAAAIEPERGASAPEPVAFVPEQTVVTPAAFVPEAGVVAEPGALQPEPFAGEPRPEASAVEPEPFAGEPRAEPFAGEPQPVAAVPLQEAAPPPPIDLPVLARCPKLGFEDDPSNAFNRPTRLHRCFAGATSLPLSLDQQRELCLSDHYDTCPRLAQAVAGPDAGSVDESATDDPRIVRLPFVSRGQTLDRGPVNGNGSISEPTLLYTSPTQDVEDPTTRPTPLRSRMLRPNGAIGAATATASAVHEPVADIAAAPQPPLPPPPSGPRPFEQMAAADGPGERRFGLPATLIVGAVVVVAFVAITGYLLLPRIGSLFADESSDPAVLPNTALIEAGTPVTSLPGARPTPAVQPTNATLVQTIPTTVPGSDAGQAAPAAQPTAVIAATPVVLFDEPFTANDAGWRSDPQGTAVLSGGMYRIATRQSGQFVAISAPIVNLPADVIVGATFRKLAGPTGGGYGLIVRDDGQTLLDGTTQDGRYYVFEVGDKGEIGIWRREADHWVDLLPWQHADAVKPGTATNELSVRAQGNRLSLSVNGTQVASVTDATLAGGHAGIFVGGDDNQVGVSHFAIQTP